MLLSSKYALISPCSELDIDGIVVGNSLVRSTKNGANLPVRVANLSCEDLKIEKGTTLGFMQSVDESDILNENSIRVLSSESVRLNQVSAKGAVNTSSWSKPLQELYTRSCENLSETQQSELKNLLNRYRNVFSTSPTDLGKTNIVHHSIPTGNARPIKLPPRRTPRAFADEEDKIIKKQVDAGIIRESSSPWSAALVYVKKKDGSTRPCVDYHRLNAVTTKDAYPLPRIDDCLDSLEGAVYFSSMDLTSGFYQIPVKDSDIEKTAFSTSTNGLYEYVMMPMGLCGSPNTFQRCMELDFRGLQWRTLLIYLDDIISFGHTFSEALNRLEEILKRLQEANLKLKPQKCSLFQKEISVLGYRVNASGILPQPSKCDLMKSWPVPRNLTDVRSFLGFVGYYRRFIKNFSARAVPLNRLMKAGQSFIWTEECQEAFLDLKSALMGDEVMSFPRFDENGGMFIVDADASDHAIGGCLSQLQWCEEAKCEVERPIMFASKSWIKHRGGTIQLRKNFWQS